MECFSIEFVSPERSVSFPRVCSLCVRTEKGELVIMAHHEWSSMSLLSGAVSFRDESGSIKAIMVSNALMSMKDNTCTIIADTVLLPEDGKDKLLSAKGKLNTLPKGDFLAGVARADLEFIDRALSEDFPGHN